MVLMSEFVWLPALSPLIALLQNSLEKCLTSFAVKYALNNPEYLVCLIGRCLQK